MSGLVGASQVMMTQSQKMNGKYTHSLPGAGNVSEFEKYFRHQKIFHNMGNSVKEKHLKTFYSLVYLVDNRENYNLSGVICSSQGLN